jgi:hypothetical protein
MGIVSTGKMIVGSEEVQKEVQMLSDAAAARPLVQNIPIEQANKGPVPLPASDHHLVVIDGKTKKVSKTSKYLLDMMTVE